MLSLGSSLPSVEVLEALDQHGYLLEKAVAQYHGYKQVAILSVDSARRLREAVGTQVRFRFEATSHSTTETIRPQGELETMLQKSFEEAGLDFQVQSAATEIISSEVSTSSSQPAESGGS